MAKIAIDAGHGLYTAGKRCLKSLDLNETREWVLNNRVANALGEYLKSAGHSILRVDDTDGSTDVSLANRVKKANNWGADAYVSIHHNAGVGGGSGGGTVVYVGTGNQPKSTVLQNAVYKHAVAEANLKGNRSDGTLAANFYVVMNTNMPAILVECGFMDSSTDIKYILDANWSKKMGLGIAKGVCEIYGGTVNAGTFVPTKTENVSTDTSTAKSSDAVYQAYAAGKWWSYVTNWGDGTEGYAGLLGSPLRALRAYVKGKAEEVGYLEYRLHRLDGEWYNWQRDRELDQNGENYAGDLKNRFDGLQMRIVGVSGRHVRYRVHVIGVGWLDWITDYGEGDNGYAGLWGYAIDAVQIDIV